MNPEKNLVDGVLIRIQQFQQTNELILPQNYSAENALKSAYLILKETLDRDKKPVLESCTKESISLALLDMVAQGLSPVKKQCYFIAYGSKLSMQRSYMGSVAVAKRVGLKSIVANVIYKNDDFAFEVDTETGLMKLTKHIQSLENIDLKNIRGAYAVTIADDGTKELTVMNFEQIKNAWNQGAPKGNSPAHQNFTDEMCKKTVISRAVKSIINSSDDSHLFNEEEKTPAEIDLSQNANRKMIDFDMETTTENRLPEALPVSANKITIHQPPLNVDQQTGEIFNNIPTPTF